MKRLKPLITGLVLCLAQLTGSAQPDTAKIAEKAMFFADSLVKADTYQNWNIYADLSIPSVVKYFGGKAAYIELIQKEWATRVSSLQEDRPTMKFMNLLTHNEQWQCVIQESRYIHRDDKKLHIITYFVGQSTDDGNTWHLFDVSYNKVANIIYMMPDVLDLPIPEHSVLTEEEELAQAKSQAARSAPAATAGGHGRKKG
jgi:hypothetical protein